MATEPLVAPAEALVEQIRRAAVDIGAPEGFEPRLERPADPDHGDFASNAALVLAGQLGRAPREVARELAERIDTEAAVVGSVDVAGPGFLNFRVADGVLWRGLGEILRKAETWGRTGSSTPERINVEFVSANPTGPLHVAHGRGAAIGDATASLLEWSGHDVVREFYVNDAGRQIELLGESVEARFRQARGEAAELPDGGYQGDYVSDLAADIVAQEGPGRLDKMEPPSRCALFADRAAEILRQEQARDLSEFGVHMDVFFAESSLFETGDVSDLLVRLENSGHTYRDEGALWLRTTEFGDDKDRVLLKSDGAHTYLVSDIAYHMDKVRRGFERAIDVWGADHHGHVPRMRAAMAALRVPEDFFEALLIQLVTILRGGAEVRMSKRAGQFVTLRELFQETGVDVARYFFLMRRAEVPMNFDLDLALDTSEANPVYKIQYAHARMCSIFERGGIEPGDIIVSDSELEHLRAPSEREIVKALLRFPDRVASAARARAPYQVCAYLEELAGLVNAWYHEGNLDPQRRVLADGPGRPARLALTQAIRITLREGLSVLGISAPEKMVRESTA